MITVTSTPLISKTALYALTELTGEPRPDVALLLTIRDAVAHRLEKIDAAIGSLEQKYGMSFEQFQALGEEKKLPNQFSVSTENDYFEWDGLISRKQKLEKIGQWLI
jgi:hypothetical protein